MALKRYHTNQNAILEVIMSKIITQKGQLHD